MRSAHWVSMVAVLFVAILLVPPVAQATDLRTGAWQMDANGFTGTLQINGVDGSGNLNGTMFGDPIVGFYNNVSNRIVFIRGLGGSPIAIGSTQVFEGVLVGTNPLPGAPVGSQLMSGTFIGFAPSGATVNRFNFGWAAVSP